MDFKLKVFKKVAEKLSFTKAAQELFISQPAVTKNINTIEKELNIKLFERKGNHIELTDAGKILLNYAKKIDSLYKNMDFEISALREEQKGKLRIGSSTTITQYVMPPLMSNFKSKFKDLTIKVINGNTEQIENALRKNEIDLGIIEGHSKHREFHYLQFLEDEIVLTVKSTHSLAQKSEITLEELQSLPLILREEGSGTLDVIAHHMNKHNLKLNDFDIVMHFGSTEGIKNYLLNSNTAAFLSIQSITKELHRNELSIIDIKGFEIKRCFSFIFPEGQQNPIMELFIRFARHYNF